MSKQSKLPAGATLDDLKPLTLAQPTPNGAAAPGAPQAGQGATPNPAPSQAAPNMLEAALWYAQAWPIFPLKPGDKTPLTTHGVKDATQDPAQVAEWWRKWPTANIGLDCGGAGLVTLDFDTDDPKYEGDGLLTELWQEYPTTAAQSGGGGYHLLYRQPAGDSVGNSPGGLPAKVHVRGIGGYIVLAPSMHPSGNRYRWVSGHKPTDMRPAPLPAFVLALLRGERINPHDGPPAAPAAPADNSDRIRLAVESLNARRAADYFDWLAVGMALHAWDQAAGLALWDAFSRRCPEKYRDGETAKLWKRFKAGGGRTVATVFKWADEDAPGWWKALPRRTPGVTGARFKAGDRCIWRSQDTDFPVTITGVMGEQDGMIWYSTDNGPGGLPEAQLRLAPDDAAPGDLVVIGDVDEDDTGDGHPLNVAAPAQPLRLGWVDDYATVMTQLTGAPYEFNRLCGLVAAATAIERRAWLPMSFGDIYPNVYAAILAPSSVFHKSTALDQVGGLLRRARLDKLLLAGDMTAEGLVRGMQTRPAGLIVNHEIGRIFNSHNVKYLANLKPTLTDCFDCKPFARRLSTEEIRVDAPYLSILGATTPARFFEGVSFTDWQDGFLARWLFVLPEGEPDFDAVAGIFTPDQSLKLQDLAMTLERINRQGETAFTFAGDAFKLWDTWARAGVKAAYHFGDDTATSLVARYNVYALKLALILAAVNDSWGTVTPETMQAAMALADGFKAAAYRLLSERANFGVSGAKLQKVFRVIKDQGALTGIPRKTILQYSKLRAGDLTIVLEKLLEIGAIMESTTGRAPRYISATDALPVKTWR